MRFIIFDYILRPLILRDYKKNKAMGLPDELRWWHKIIAEWLGFVKVEES